MSPTVDDPREHRVLILAPRGRDAAVAEQVLERAGFACTICADVDQFRVSLAEGAGAALVTEEALAQADTAALATDLDRQPAWSDFPFIVLSTRQIGPRAPRHAHMLEQLGSLVLLERPINAETLASAVGSALRARRRQYQAQRHLLDRERAEERLRVLNDTLEQRVRDRTQEMDHARETLAFALDSAEMGLWDLDLVADLSNRSLQHDRIFGYSTAVPQWGRASFLHHVEPDDRAAADQAFADAVAGGTLALECRIRTVSGALRWIALRGRVKFNAGGIAVRLVSIVMDTTDRRLTEDALRQAQKMEAIGQLTGGVAHDFNNLLTVIVGGLDMVIRRPDPPARVLRLAEAAMTAARRGEQLTQQLLAFSRRQMLHPETLDPNRLLSAFEILARRAAGETVTLQFELEEAVHPIRVDPAQFESAVLNLIVNARDAMPGGGRVSVRSRNADLDPVFAAAEGLSPGAYVAIAVADDGTGIDPATLAHVFEPFFTTKEVGKGSGLGLSQVYGFAKSAGGHVTVESRPGHGTVVTLYFPQSVDRVAAARPVVATVPLQRALGGETILVVEDDEQVLGMTVESLQELDYGIIVARNAAEALGHLDGPARIDVLFSDVVMPGGMNGTQLAHEALRRRGGLKILLTSGYLAGEGDLVDDALPVLTKPYKRDELVQKLQQVLSRP